jgi:hypothetical protein
MEGAPRRSARIDSLLLQFREASQGAEIRSRGPDTVHVGGIDHQAADVPADLLLDNAFFGAAQRHRVLRLRLVDRCGPFASFYRGVATLDGGSTATCLLLDTKLSNGKLLVEGKTWTGFANSEEQFADDFVGKRIQPFWIEDEARKINGTNFVVDQMFREFALRDGLLVTGQQQFSGAAAARLVIEALGR